MKMKMIILNLERFIMVIVLVLIITRLFILLTFNCAKLLFMIYHRNKANMIMNYYIEIKKY